MAWAALQKARRNKVQEKPLSLRTLMNELTVLEKIRVKLPYLNLLDFPKRGCQLANMGL